MDGTRPSLAPSIVIKLHADAVSSEPLVQARVPCAPAAASPVQLRDVVAALAAQQQPARELQALFMRRPLALACCDAYGDELLIVSQVRMVAGCVCGCGRCSPLRHNAGGFGRRADGLASVPRARVTLALCALGLELASVFPPAVRGPGRECSSC